MKIAIEIPGVDPYSAKFTRTVELVGHEGINDTVMFTFTKEAIFDFIRVAQQAGMSIYIKPPYSDL